MNINDKYRLAALASLKRRARYWLSVDLAGLVLLGISAVMAHWFISLRMEIQSESMLYPLAREVGSSAFLSQAIASCTKNLTSYVFQSMFYWTLIACFGVSLADLSLQAISLAVWPKTDYAGDLLQIESALSRLALKPSLFSLPLGLLTAFLVFRVSPDYFIEQPGYALFVATGVAAMFLLQPALAGRRQLGYFEKLQSAPSEGERLRVIGKDVAGTLICLAILVLLVFLLNKFWVPRICQRTASWSTEMRRIAYTVESLARANQVKDEQARAISLRITKTSHNFDGLQSTFARLSAGTVSAAVFYVGILTAILAFPVLVPRVRSPVAAALILMVGFGGLHECLSYLLGLESTILDPKYIGAAALTWVATRFWGQFVFHSLKRKYLCERCQAGPDQADTCEKCRGLLLRLVASKKQGVVHRENCPFVSLIRETNREYFATPAQAQSRGYEKCNFCRPGVLPANPDKQALVS